MNSKTTKLWAIPTLFVAALVMSACSSDPMMKGEKMDAPMMYSMDKGMDKKMDDSMHESKDMKM